MARAPALAVVGDRDAAHHPERGSVPLGAGDQRESACDGVGHQPSTRWARTPRSSMSMRHAREDPDARLAPGVHAERPPDPHVPGRLVDVSVHREDRLEFLDDAPDADRAARNLDDLPARDHRAQIVVEERHGVDRRVARRHVRHQHRGARVVRLLDEGAQLRFEVVLLEFPRRVPRGRVGGCEADQLAPVREAHDATVRVDDAGRLREHRVDLVGIVVSRDQVQRRTRLAQTLVRELHPHLQPLGDRLEEPLLLGGGIPQIFEIAVAHRDGVKALVGQRPLELPELVLAGGDELASAELAVPAAVRPDERNDRLAGEVARDEDGVRLPDTEPDRVQELAPGSLGGMQVGGNEQAHGQNGCGERSAAGGRVKGTCGSTWYQNATVVRSSGRLFACPCSIVTRIDPLNRTGSSTW